MAADREAFEAAVARTSPERWAQAAADANLVFPASVKGFGDILGVEIGSTATPHLAMLLQRTMIDAGLGTYKAKTHYARVRPFVAMESPTCAPQDEAALRKDGSYPSGHSAIGWAWALVLTQVAPDKADALLQRGRDFGESRIVCRVHWRSDVAAGRFVAAGIVARLQSDPVFSAQLALAQRELAAAHR
jgi:acid phosphatase (class A)